MFSDKLSCFLWIKILTLAIRLLEFQLKRIRVGVFSVYIAIVLWITLIDRKCGKPHAMLIPFWELTKVIKGVERSFYIKQILGNLIMLLPFGYMLPMLRKVTLKQVLLISMLFSVSIEVLQFVTGRGLMEFDDVFNNTVGAVLGFIVYHEIIYSKRDRSISNGNTKQGG